MNINEILSTTATDKVSQTTGNSKKSVANDNFNSYMNKTYTLDDIINIASDKYNVSKDLVCAVIKTESSFVETAVSYCGATGYMQLMPATAKSLGVTDSTDPVQNIMGGTKLLSQLLDKYDGNVSLALAAYNGGPGNVAKYNGVPPFCKDYVNKVTKYMNEGVKVPDKTVTVNIMSCESELVKGVVDKSKNVNTVAKPKTASKIAMPVSSKNITPTYIEESEILTPIKSNLFESFKRYTEYTRLMDLLTSNDSEED